LILLGLNTKVWDWRGVGGEWGVYVGCGGREGKGGGGDGGMGWMAVVSLENRYKKSLDGTI
jgi:hypothetical protein